MKRLRFGVACIALAFASVVAPFVALPHFPTVSAAAITLVPHSGQCHWVIGATGNTVHVHNDNGDGHYIGDVTGPFVVPFLNTLFHTEGFIGPYYVGNQKTSDAQDSLFWDDTQGSRQPVEQGDPAGVRTWGGHFTIVPGTLDANNHVVPVRHGWAHLNSNAYAFFPDGAVVKDILYEPYHSMIDPRVPEVLSNQDQYVMAECDVDSLNSANDYGQQTVTIESLLPQTAVSAPFELVFSTYNYANNFVNPEPAVSDVILDPDFHHCVIAPINPNCAGTTLFSAVSPHAADFVSQHLTLVPSQMGPAGLHKVAVRRCTPNHGDTLCTLMVFGVMTSVGGPVVVPPVPTPTPDPVPTPTPAPVLPVLLGPASLYRFPDGARKVCGNDGMALVCASAQ